MGRVNNNHYAVIEEMLEDCEYKLREELPSTGEMVAVLMKGSSDHKVRPPLPKSAANNVVQAVRKKQGLYKPRTGSYADSTNYALQKQRKRWRKIDKAQSQARDKMAEVVVHNRLDEVPEVVGA